MWLQRFFRRDPPTITITTTSTTSSHTDNTNANGNGKPQRESLLPEDIASLELGIPEPEPFPSQADFFRYRKQRGVNLGIYFSSSFRPSILPSSSSPPHLSPLLFSLGSWFVLESWITPTPFRFVKEPRQSDLDIARGSYAKQVLERHWDNWMTESDWIWLAKRGINTVRIPVRFSLSLIVFFFFSTGLDSFWEGEDFANPR